MNLRFSVIAIVHGEATRRRTLREHGLDFADAEKVFGHGSYIENIDDRFDHGEDRYLTIGLLDQAPVVLVWTPRGIDKRVISMRKANGSEKILQNPWMRTTRPN